MGYEIDKTCQASFINLKQQIDQQVIISMSLRQLFQKKLKLQMKLIHIIQRKPKQIIKLDPIDPEDFILSHEAIREWSDNNQQLYQTILQNGMAEFVCNKEYLYQFYRHLAFNQQSIQRIDEASLNFKNLKSLSLLQNQIKTIQNLPVNCKELYLDFNPISSIHLKHPHHLELLSISNNLIDDDCCLKLTHTFPQLRCLNLSWNKVCNLKQFVTNLASLHKLKILVAYGNPISMLAIYYSYLTEHIHLAYIDGTKYVKVQEVKKEEPKVEEKKEVKEEKKDTKKDNKKGAKQVQEKPVEQPPKVEPPKQVPKKQLTKQDFQKVKLSIKIENLQRFTGNTYEASLFPPDTDVSKIQTSYWVKYTLMGQETEEKHKAINFDNATIDNDETRLNLDVSISKTFEVSYENFLKFNQGVKIEVYQSEPKMIKDSQTLQYKPQIKDNAASTKVSVLGATHIDLRKIHSLNKKEEKLKYVLFSAQAVNNPLFYDPYEDQKELISKQKDKFEAKLKKIQEERLKKLQEQQLLKQQKKGGKDQKKAADKKPPPKKDGKDAVVVEKKKSQKCDYPVEQREYCILQNEKMFKGKELLCVRIKVQ